MYTKDAVYIKTTSSKFLKLEPREDVFTHRNDCPKHLVYKWRPAWTDKQSFPSLPYYLMFIYYKAGRQTLFTRRIYVLEISHDVL